MQLQTAHLWLHASAVHDLADGRLHSLEGCDECLCIHFLSREKPLRRRRQPWLLCLLPESRRCYPVGQIGRVGLCLLRALLLLLLLLPWALCGLGLVLRCARPAQHCRVFILQVCCQAHM
jgi:hypothetical protein